MLHSADEKLAPHTASASQTFFTFELTQFGNRQNIKLNACLNDKLYRCVSLRGESEATDEAISGDTSSVTNTLVFLYSRKGCSNVNNEIFAFANRIQINLPPYQQGVRVNSMEHRDCFATLAMTSAIVVFFRIKVYA